MNLKRNIALLVLGILIATSSSAETLPAVRINDLRVMLCRKVGKEKMCADYSLKSWPLGLKGAGYLLEHCIPPDMIATLSSFCDRWNRDHSDGKFKVSFYKFYPACRIIWKSAMRFETDAELYAEDYNRSNCFSGEF